MDRNIVTLGGCSFEILRDGDQFKGIGAVEIDGKLVRSGRLPLSPHTQTFTGMALSSLKLLDVVKSAGEIRIKTRALFNLMPVKTLRDHSFDPIHDIGDWDELPIAGDGELDLVLKPCAEDYFGYGFTGLSYHYEYKSENTPIFYLYDRASWEIGGDVTGSTAYNQSACTPPVAKLSAETEWSTEGKLHWLAESPGINPIMTHNLPRWASHQCFDFQFKGDDTLIGVYERVDLIRSLLIKEKGKPELKVFDKHIFTETLAYATSPKRILLSGAKKSEVDQKNLWTWLIQELHDKARAEYGLREETFVPRLSWNYWSNFTLDSYYIDLLPAAVNTGIRALFIDNVFKSDMSAGSQFGNMCCGHEYEPAPELAGRIGHKKFVEDCKKLGITPYSWTNNDQSYLSPLNNSERDEERLWYIKMEDSRTKYAGAYTNCMSFLRMNNPEVTRYFIDAKLKIKEETGYNSYLFDSFYNAAFMPVDYTGMKPTTMWRETLMLMKELQDADIHFMIESFGPFGEVQHGCHKEFNLENLFSCYKIHMGTGYTTIPSGNEEARSAPYPEKDFYRILSYMAGPGFPLFYSGRRIDTLYTEEHRRALRDYYACLPAMGARVLQEGDTHVLWHGKGGERVIWNHAAQKMPIEGVVTDVSAGKVLAKEAAYSLEAGHTYKVV